MACDKEGNCRTFAPRLWHLYLSWSPSHWASDHILVVVVSVSVILIIIITVVDFCDLSMQIIFFIYASVNYCLLQTSACQAVVFEKPFIVRVFGLELSFQSSCIRL